MPLICTPSHFYIFFFILTKSLILHGRNLYSLSLINELCISFILIYPSRDLFLLTDTDLNMNKKLKQTFIPSKYVVNPTDDFIDYRKSLSKKRKSVMKNSQLRRLQFIRSKKGGQALLQHIQMNFSEMDLTGRTGDSKLHHVPIH